ncbi:MAG: right-handed parallel beta-helix repeat-containing protein [Candidatus Cloacimonetes bacterium]|nr:right-handed parallel beta-helix repeat-containing protein [Candidatus Cloacimonadota bacterium]
MKNIKVILFVLSILLYSFIALADTINIPGDQPTIQAGIDIAVESDTVLVQPGTYIENINYNGKNITVASLFIITQDTTYISQTIIDGNQDGSVVTFENFEDSTAVLSGFTITNGLGGGTNPNYTGGGITCRGSGNLYEWSDPKIENVHILNNSSQYGGGIYCRRSHPIIENVTIANNSAHLGGGIYFRTSFRFSNLRNVTLVYNSAVSLGGGIYCKNSNPILENVTIASNSADHGGGIYCVFNSNLSLENVTITSNSAENCGAGLSCSSSDASLVDVLITNNSATEDGACGGGIFCYDESNLILENVMIANNSVVGNNARGGGVYCSNSNLTFSVENRCNIYSNEVASNRGVGSDIYSLDNPIIDIIVDTFTVLNPSDHYTSPIDNFTFDILNSIEDNLLDSDLYVAVDGNNSNSGASADDPFQTITHALQVIYSDSLNINTIHLAEGVYSPSTNGEYFPLQWINYVNLSGISEDESVLDADNMGSVFELRNISEALIENVTVSGGFADYGGGFHCDDYSNPSLQNLTITNNTAGIGGGIYCINNSNPNIQNVTIANNSADKGGGIYFFCGSTPNLVNVIIANNSADDDGGGIYCTSTNPSLEDVTILNNSADSEGGGIYCSSSGPSLENVAITGNFAGWYGGGIFCRHDSNPILENVTITNNSAEFRDGGGICCYNNSNPILVNCILWNDSPQEIFYSIYGDPNMITLAYSDIQGGEDGIVTNNNGTVNWLDGNIDSDPIFVDPINGDYHLSINSPCIDAGDPDSPLDPDGTIVDMGAYFYQQFIPPEADFTADPLLGVAPLEVHFSDLTVPNYNPIISWQWDFDNDGTIDSNEQNPNYTYDEIGVYTVSLIVSDGYSNDTEIKDNYIEVTGAGTDFIVISPKTRLYRNHPNPFNPTTTIKFSLQNNSNVELSVYNIKGQKIKTLTHNKFTKGSHSIIWSGEDENNKQVASGIYFYQLKTDSKTITKKCILMK